ncbi:MAG: DUF1840 domain-containing protein [Betaproteobacteria bacterium]|nr:DUF1840 domain-containing protein [Betaproteobacteria bacterium]
MLYKFKSRAAADLVMLEPAGRRLLEVLGREPSSQGIFEAADLHGLMQRLDRAIELEEAMLEQAERDAQGKGQTIRRPEVSLRQRLWPMREMMRRAQAEGHDIVWGV